MDGYRPLRLDRPEFRLLRLHSIDSSKAAHTPQLSAIINKLRDIALREGHGEDDKIPISCDLYHAFRDEDPQYETLSYTWGDPSETATIIVDGQSRQVTVNLRDALRHIRRKSQDVHLWIDALCINQSDTEEKGHQVGQMRDIYGEASNTIVWLGTASDGSETTIEELNRTGRMLKESGIRGKLIALARLSSNQNTEYAELEKEINNDLADLISAAMLDIPKVIDMANGLRALSLRPYWNRVWIIQEYVVSRNIDIRCGGQVVPFDHFHGCLLYLPFLTINVVQRLHRHIVSIMETQDVTELAGQFMTLCNNQINPQTNSISGMRLRFGDHGEAAQGMILIRLLAKVHIGLRSCATQDRDRIFALLGLASDATLLEITPDYSPDTTSADIYTTTARKIIDGGNIDILSLAQHREHREDIPSWVPDWSKEILRPCGQLPWDSSFDVSAGATLLSFSSDSQMPISHDEIRLCGYILDSVDRLAPEPWCPDPEGVNKSHPGLLGYLQGIQELCRLSEEQLKSGSHGKDPYPNPEDRASAYLRIPIADMEQYGIGFIRRASKDPEGSGTFPGLLRGYEGVLEEIRSGISGGETGIQSEDVSGFYNMLGWQAYRRGVLLKSGLVGLAPASVEVGDVVVIFRGAKFPYVLRKCEKAEAQGRWRLVGEAYVHGIMYGELFRGDNEVHDLRPAQFVLR
ncbi:uncharacterized protein E0L32_011861 [Thyridium curvatum]|uniref:Heterokaryon incompatibility domain-containing protein n=1 Tax=Thyridium curvatum TaxID=1093900 RepID=A0A507B6W4_9PEZI|nr:uncharacterized protein E0L32_011861 [Thyridium curvatum]TPX18042.1 hypothetical protein E0L32_011861 [Thyridium curvatum]